MLLTYVNTPHNPAFSRSLVAHYRQQARESGMVVSIGDEHLPRLSEAGAVGDRCGIYYNRQGQMLPSGVKDRMMAARVNQLKAVGCLPAVACGEDKAVAVLGALRTGLISALFIDQAMAEQILAGVDRPRAPARQTGFDGVASK